jgi:hypothetical protein
MKRQYRKPIEAVSIRRLVQEKSVTLWLILSFDLYFSFDMLLLLISFMCC